MFTFYGLAIASFWEYLFNWTSLLQYVKKLFIDVMIAICYHIYLSIYLPAKVRIKLELVFVLYPAMMANND